MATMGKRLVKNKHNYGVILKKSWYKLYLIKKPFPFQNLKLRQCYNTERNTEKIK